MQPSFDFEFCREDRLIILYLKLSWLLLVLVQQTHDSSSDSIAGYGGSCAAGCAQTYTAFKSSFLFSHSKTAKQLLLCLSFLGVFFTLNYDNKVMKKGIQIAALVCGAAMLLWPMLQCYVLEPLLCRQMSEFRSNLSWPQHQESRQECGMVCNATDNFNALECKQVSPSCAGVV